MLETTRRRGATIAIYVIFGILIAVFVLNFGPNSGGGQQGCSGTGNQTIVSISEKEYGMPTWRWAFNTRGQGTYGSRITAALDGLIRRELLAQEADARGLRIEDDLVDQNITQGDVWVLTEYFDGKQLYFEDGEFFNYKLLERNLVSRFGLSIGAFKAEQRRELLANMMAEVLASGGRASKDEALAQYNYVHSTVTADAVAFPVEAYKAKAVVTDADVERWLGTHTAEVQAKYDADKSTAYTGTPKKVRVRRVFVARTPEPETKPEEAKPADETKPADPPAAPAPVEAKPDPAKAKLEAARAEIVAKKKKVADVARAMDAEAPIAARGGDLGWLLPDAPGLGDPALGDALKAIADKPGEPSPVIETPRGYFVLVVEDSREGDLTFDQVKHEIAASLALDSWADEAARRAAIATLNEARNGTGKNLADMFDKAAEPAGPTPGQQLDLEELIRNNPDLDPQTIEEIRKMIEQQQQSGESGAIQVESANVPVAWRAQADGPSPAPLADAAAPTAIKPAEPPTTPPADSIMKPSTDVLPKFDEVKKATVQRIGPMPHDREQVGALGKSTELMTALFALGDGALADRIYKVETRVGTAYVVAQVIKREQPDPAQFEKQADELVRRLTDERGGEIVTAWLKGRCAELQNAGKIKFAKDLLQERNDQGEVKAIAYDPCQGIE